MMKFKKKFMVSFLVSVLTLSSILFIILKETNMVYASESKYLRSAKAKINHLTSSLKTNYLGIKNQSTWEIYIKEARELISKIPNSEKYERDALTVEVNKDEALVKGLGRINHVEKSVAPKSEGGYGNYLGIKNAETWREYLRLAKIDLEKVDKSIFQNQHDELISRINYVDKIIQKIESDYEEDYTIVLDKYNSAKKSMNLEEAKESLNIAKQLGSCERTEKIKKDIQNLINKIQGSSSLDIADIIDEQNDKKNYKVELSEPGILYIDFSFNMEHCYIYLVDEDGKEEILGGLIGGYINNEMKKWTKHAYLEAGTYYIKINRFNWSTSDNGNFTLKTSFTSANNEEKEPNNSAEFAQKINIGDKINAFISYQDDKDIYKIDIDKKGKLTIDLSLEMDCLLLNIYKKDTVTNIRNSFIRGRGISEMKKASETIDLEAGSYYIELQKHIYSEKSCGKYEIEFNIN